MELECHAVDVNEMQAYVQVPYLGHEKLSVGKSCNRAAKSLSNSSRLSLSIVTVVMGS